MDVLTTGLAPVELVARIMDDARGTFPKDEALAIALAKEGVAGDGGRPYSSKTVSAWATGKAIPPGNVVLIAARLAGLRLDDYLYPGGGETDKADRELLKQLVANDAKRDREIRELRESLKRELEHLHEEMRNESQKMRASAAARAKLDEGQSPD